MSKRPNAFMLKLFLSFTILTGCLYFLVGCSHSPSDNFQEKIAIAALLAQQNETTSITISVSNQLSGSAAVEVSGSLIGAVMYGRSRTFSVRRGTAVTVRYNNRERTYTVSDATQVLIDQDW